MIQEYCNLADKVIVIISNISTKVISARPLSKGNLQPLAKLISKYNQLNIKNNEIETIFNELINNADNISYNELINNFNKIEQIIKSENKKDYQFILEEINKIKEQLNNLLFKSVRKTNTNMEIEPETAKKILDLYVQRYNLQNKVLIQISQNPSPMADVVSIVNQDCKNCTIYLGVSKKRFRRKPLGFIFKEFWKKSNK